MNNHHPRPSPGDDSASSSDTDIENYPVPEPIGVTIDSKSDSEYEPSVGDRSASSAPEEYDELDYEPSGSDRSASPAPEEYDELDYELSGSDHSASPASEERDELPVLATSSATTSSATHKRTPLPNARPSQTQGPQGSASTSTSTQAGSAASPAQLDLRERYGFNTYLEGYEHHIPKHLTEGTILYMAGTQSRRGPHTFDVAPPLTPTEKEVDPVGHEGLSPNIWVGMFSMSAATQENVTEDTDEGNDETSVTASAGTLRTLADAQSVDELHIIAHDPKALRVVINKEGAKSTCYALVDPDEEGLCMGMPVPVDKVFFFHYFRDDTASSQELRRVGRNNKIREIQGRPPSRTVKGRQSKNYQATKARQQTNGPHKGSRSKNPGNVANHQAVAGPVQVSLAADLGSADGSTNTIPPTSRLRWLCPVRPRNQWLGPFGAVIVGQGYRKPPSPATKVKHSLAIQLPYSRELFLQFLPFLLFRSSRSLLPFLKFLPFPLFRSKPALPYLQPAECPRVSFSPFSLPISPQSQRLLATNSRRIVIRFSSLSRLTRRPALSVCSTWAGSSSAAANKLCSIKALPFSKP